MMGREAFRSAIRNPQPLSSSKRLVSIAERVDQSGHVSPLAWHERTHRLARSAVLIRLPAAASRGRAGRPCTLNPPRAYGSGWASA